MTEVDVKGTMLDAEAMSATCCGPVGVMTTPLCQMSCGMGKAHGETLPVLTNKDISPKIRARCTRPASVWLYSTVVKHGDQTILNCSSFAAMIALWSAGSLAPTTETKVPQLHYYRNLALRILRQSFAVRSSDGMVMYSVPGPVSYLSQNFPFLVLKNKEGLKRRRLNAWRLMSVIVTWLALTW